MPWTKVRDAGSAADRHQRRQTGPTAVSWSMLHAGRSTTTLADLAAIPGSRLSYAQLCDAPGEVPTTQEGLIHTARCARLLPGEGSIDLVGIVSQLPADLPLSLEIPNDERLPKLGAQEWARQALAAAKRIIASSTCPKGAA